MILSLLLSPAFATDNAAQLQTELQIACTQNTSSVVVTLGPSLTLSPDQTVVYPPAGCVNPSPPALVFRPEATGGRSRIQGEARVTGGASVLFTFGAGTDVRFEEVDLVGPLVGDPGTEDGTFDSPADPDLPGCAALGGSVQGIQVNGGDPSQLASSLELRNSTLVCLEATSGRGGGIRAENADVTVSGSTFDRIRGGGVFAMGPLPGRQISVSDSAFHDNVGVLGGGLAADNLTVQLEDSTFVGNRATSGGSDVHLAGLGSSATAVLSGNVFRPTGAPTTGGSMLVEGDGDGALDYRGNLVCGGSADRGGAVYARDVDLSLENNLFIENTAALEGGAVFVEGEASAATEVLHNAFLANTAVRLGGGGALHADGPMLAFRNNLVGWSEGGAVGAAGNSVLVPNHNLWWSNLSGGADADLVTGFAGTPRARDLIATDPMLLWTPGICDVVGARPMRTSPVIDAGGGPPDSVTGLPGPCVDWGDIDVPPDHVNDGPLVGDVACDIGPWGGQHALLGADMDLDGVSVAYDCDDTDNAISPVQPEVCDGLDQNCDGDIDEGVLTWWVVDEDGDGHGDAQVEAVPSCFAIPDAVEMESGDDCDDSDPNVFTGAFETCDGVDNDCDGLGDLEDPDLATFDLYLDADADGFGAGPPILSCIPSAGFVTDSTDCDDTDVAVNPAAVEVCATVGVDDDCDGRIDAADDAVPDLVWVYRDGDGDGVGASDEALETCAERVPAGYVDASGDCDDEDPLIISCIGEPLPIDECGCSSGPSPAGLALPLMALALLRRRRSA